MHYDPGHDHDAITRLTPLAVIDEAIAALERSRALLTRLALA